MKKFFVFLLIAVVAISSACLATENVTSLEDYDDFISAYNGEDTQSEMKEYYREFLAYSREQDAQNQSTNTVKAKVIDVSDKNTTYGMDYYTPYKITYQPIKVEILEGEYKGKVLDVQYILTADTYGNIEIPEINVGAKIFVVVEADDSTGEVSAYTASYDSRISRFPLIVVLCIVTALIIIILGKIKGLKLVLLAVLIFDLIFVVTLPQMVKNNNVLTLDASDRNFPSTDEIENDESITILTVDDDGQPTKVEMIKKSNSVIWLAILDAIIISGVCLINNLGLDKKAFIGFGITVAMLIFTILLLCGINILTNMNGNAFEAISVTESVINRNIDFGTIYLFSVLMIASVIIPNMISKVLVEYGNENYKECIKDYLSSQVGIIFVISLALLLLKVITLIIFKYSNKDLLNSEMILNEIVRMIVLIISAALTIPVTELSNRKIVKG